MPKAVTGSGWGKQQKKGKRRKRTAYQEKTKLARALGAFCKSRQEQEEGIVREVQRSEDETRNLDMPLLSQHEAIQLCFALENIQ